MRALLLPNPDTGRIEADVFPRSAIMRVVLDPRRRRLATAGLAALSMLFARRGKGGSNWSEAMQSIGEAFSAARS
ncbi:MAG: hypothetical protein WDO12_05000 [Pseudomonadota bacterium]